ncbi:MAG: fibrobacter succinogenes major paralogous domain-containing protein [Bacteroidales bacterium]|nr:fibrobacter succinogenes major paralogous domain-containing protein [Bacteroidales bacterium]
MNKLSGQVGCDEDINHDSRIDGFDYLQLIGRFGTVCNVFLPTVVSESVSNITHQSVEIAGNITDDGGSEILFRGICWGIIPNPTINDKKTYIGADTGRFISIIEGLEQTTTYYARAYALNGVGTAYGEQFSFTTLASLPVLTTNPVVNITLNTAVSGGTIGDNGGSFITQRGVCWNTSENPTLADNHTIDGVDTGMFISNLTGLSAGTLYYVRAYATNGIGTSYGLQLSFYTTFPRLVMIDADSNIYEVDTIGSQIWISENLKTTRYNDGSNIPLISDISGWSTRIAPAYCWYNNEEAIYKSQYGALYNWYTINTNKLCPTGWHVPTDADFTTLITFLGGDTIAGGKLKEAGTTHWISPNTGATDEYGFTALPGGYRRYNGVFAYVGYYGYWWGSTSVNADNAWDRNLNYNHDDMIRENSNKKCGFSVRCLKD